LQPSYPVLDPPTPSGDGWGMALRSVTGLSVSIQYSSDLADWTTFQTTNPGASKVWIFDGESRAAPQRFYRAIRNQ
jgi:hypothetical protein